MGFIQSIGRGRMNDWAEEPQNAQKLDGTPGAREFFNKIVDKQDATLLDAYLDKHDRDGDAIKADLENLLEENKNDPQAFERLNDAYDRNPNAVAAMIQNGDDAGLDRIMHPEADAPSVEVANPEVPAAEDVVGTEPASQMEGQALEIAENAPGLMGELEGLPMVAEAASFLENIQDYLSGVGVPTEIAAMAQDFVNEVMASGVPQLQEMGEQLEAFLGDFMEENGVSLDDIKSQPDFNPTAQLDNNNAAPQLSSAPGFDGPGGMA